MTIELSSRVRKEYTEIELRRLQEEVCSWLTFRRNKDERGQYQTQLNAIDSLIDAAVKRLQTDLAAMDLGQSLGQVYENCRLFDLRILWLRRVWQFFKDKFDQRDDPQLRPLLQAADEVVWSCYRQVFAQAEYWAPDLKQGPAPLPYIESHYSPEAYPSDIVPADLKDIHLGDNFLQEHLNRLPIPVVRLPSSCIAAPWWLVYVGHEVGHHIQHDIKLVRWFREKVEEVVSQHAPPAATQWGACAEEIFADVFSVVMMGPWAVWAMVEFEFKRPENMFEYRKRYLLPAVRLELLACTADRLGLGGRSALRGLQPAAMAENRAQALQDMKLVPYVVDAALGAISDRAITLENLCDFRRDEFQPYGAVENWTQALAGQQDREPETTLRTARVVASAALAAWSEIAKIKEDTKRVAQREALARRAVEIIAKCREEGTRARDALSSGTELSKLSADLIDRLLAADWRRLEFWGV